jgi:tetratricopeptide (TPR) repeat protein
VTIFAARIICVSFTVEDLNGWSQIVSVYNFPGTFQASGEELDTIFPLNSVLAIREPTAKMALAGNHSHIRIDSPSDIIFLEPNDPILEGASWATGSKAPHMATASEKGWKAVGDDHFKRKQFFGAAVAYSKALKKDPSSVVIRLNRCITHIRLTNFAFAAHDAQIILSNEALDRADRIKALYRAALALYGSRKYKEAGNYYQACLAIEPGLKEASTGLDECRARIREEEHGIYDWKKLFNQGEAPCARPDVADYTGPVKVSSVPHRGGGRGVVAIKDIKPGELLVSTCMITGMYESLNT